jgi:hypothetical protein
MEMWTLRTLPAIVISVAMLAAVAPGAGAQSTHASLDWNATYRWVHVDNIGPDPSAVFERARAGWLQALRQGDSLLADGRPLFWSHRAKERSTYFTFYPFTRFGELDARRDAVRATQAAVGKDALARYDLGDAVLVPPHYSQIWRRSPDDDYVPAGGEAWTDRTAACGWMEFRTPAFEDAAVDSLWKELRVALAAEHYPLTCRVLQNVYGSSDIICMWLAPDSAALRAAPRIKDLVTRHLGADPARKFWKRLDSVFPVTSTLTVERRPELSNLGK